MPSVYADNLTVRDGRTQYFALNKLGDGGYTDRWVRFKVGPLPLFFPNTQAPSGRSASTIFITS